MESVRNVPLVHVNTMHPQCPVLRIVLVAFIASKGKIFNVLASMCNHELAIVQPDILPLLRRPSEPLGQGNAAPRRRLVDAPRLPAMRLGVSGVGRRGPSLLAAIVGRLSRRSDGSKCA